jgi:hypothetical protein
MLINPLFDEISAVIDQGPVPEPTRHRRPSGGAAVPVTE